MSQEQTEKQLPQITIYTDGGCRPNPGPGGWGAVLLRPEVKKPRELSGGEQQTTNNRMELQAAIEALRSLESGHEVQLYTDSTYLRQGVTAWLPGWRRSGWTTSAKTDVKNRDLWEQLSDELQRHKVRWFWTKGHAGNRWNERADRLASAAIPRPPLPLDDTEAVHLFTAAAYSGKRKAGAWAVVLSYQDEKRSLQGGTAGAATASANRMHLHSAVAALQALTRRIKVHLYTTSDYLKDGATSWLPAWKRRGWRTKEGKPVSHQDLWQDLDRLLPGHEIHWHVIGKEMPELMIEAKQIARDEVESSRE